MEPKWNFNQPSHPARAKFLKYYTPYHPLFPTLHAVHLQILSGSCLQKSTNPDSKTVCHHHCHPSPCHLHLLPGHHGSILTGNPASTTLLSLLHRTARVFLLNYQSNHTTSCSKLPMPSHHSQNKIRSPSPGRSGLPRSIRSLVTSPISCLHTLPSPPSGPVTLASLFSGPARHIPVAGLCAALSSA